jgi:hypothetical protein
MATLEFYGLMGMITLGAFTSWIIQGGQLHQHRAGGAAASSETGVVMALEQHQSLRSHEGLSNRHTTRPEPGETSAPWPGAARAVA